MRESSKDIRNDKTEPLKKLIKFSIREGKKIKEVWVLLRTGELAEMIF